MSVLQLDQYSACVIEKSQPRMYVGVSLPQGEILLCVLPSLGAWQCT